MMSFNRPRRAFTLIELLVVVAIIALLIAILLPSLGRAREKAKDVQCKANLHAHGSAMSIYAAEWAGKLPSDDPNAGAGLLFWDVTRVLTDVQFRSTGMDGTGATIRKTYYCPFNPDQNRDGTWNYGGASGKYRIVGYYFLYNRQNTSIQGLTLPKFAKTLTTVKAAPDDQEVITDVTMSRTGTQTYANLILGGSASLGGLTFSTSHMRNATPLGTNVLFLDSHVEMRPFKQEAVRYQSTKAAPDDVSQWF